VLFADCNLNYRVKEDEMGTERSTLGTEEEFMQDFDGKAIRK
jgi:hypothetical protein